MSARVRWVRSPVKLELEYYEPWRTAEGGWVIGRLKPPGQRATYHPKRRDDSGQEVEWGGLHHTVAAAKAEVEFRLRRQVAA